MDRNKLAWRGSPGPWMAHRINGSRTWRIYRDDIIIGQVDSNIMGPATIESNAHMASAAPEMAEFIADLLEKFDKHCTLEGLKETMFARAEELLKKAYNF